MAPPPLILASASTARRQLLENAGLHFSTAPAAVDEEEMKAAFRAEAAPAEACAEALAELKAVRVSARHPGALVIGADQILDLEGRWFDKPPDLAAARAQLTMLAGRMHRLVTAVVVAENGARVWHHIDSAVLTMRRLETPSLDAYIDAEGTALLGSVGAYRIEGPGVQLFTRIEGNFFTVIGLPLLPLLAFLRGRGVGLR